MKNGGVVKTKPCPSCKTGQIMTGMHSEFNARSPFTGNQICSDCFLAEIKEKIRAS